MTVSVYFLFGSCLGRRPGGDHVLWQTFAVIQGGQASCSYLGDVNV